MDSSGQDCQNIKSAKTKTSQCICLRLSEKEKHIPCRFENHREQFSNEFHSPTSWSTTQRAPPIRMSNLAQRWFLLILPECLRIDPNITSVARSKVGVSETVVYPIVPNGFADHYPILSLWKIAISLGILTQHFQTPSDPNETRSKPPYCPATLAPG